MIIIFSSLDYMKRHPVSVVSLHTGKIPGSMISSLNDSLMRSSAVPYKTIDNSQSHLTAQKSINEA